MSSTFRRFFALSARQAVTCEDAGRTLMSSLSLCGSAPVLSRTRVRLSPADPAISSPGTPSDLLESLAA